MERSWVWLNEVCGVTWIGDTTRGFPSPFTTPCDLALFCTILWSHPLIGPLIGQMETVIIPVMF